MDYTQEELKALRTEYAQGATDTQFTWWLAECRDRGLKPVRDLLMQIRTSKEWDPEVRAKVDKKKIIFITTIGAFRKIAEGTGKYAGQLPTKWIYLDTDGNPTIESEIPLPDPANKLLALEPWAVRTSVLRSDFQAPITVVSRFGAYAQTFTREGNTVLTGMWSSRGVEQLEKCGESACLRRGFPSELSSLFIAEEVEKYDHEEVQLPVETPKAAPPTLVVPPVSHVPATPTEEPRPTGGAAQVKTEAIVEKPKRQTKAQKEEAALTKAGVENPFENMSVEEMNSLTGPTEPEKPQEPFVSPDGDPERCGPIPVNGNSEPKIDENRLPTPEERRKFNINMREYAKIVNKDALKAWLLKQSGKDSVDALLLSDWIQLDGALRVHQENGDDLNTVVKGE